MDRWILVDHLIDIALTDAPDEVTDRLLRALLAFTEGHRAALFEVRQDRVRLSGSRGVGQAALDEVDRAWASHRQELLKGGHVPTRSGVVYPVAVKGHLVGVLFTERTAAVTFADPRDVQALSQFARLASRTLPAAGRSRPATWPRPPWTRSRAINCSSSSTRTNGTSRA